MIAAWTLCMLAVGALLLLVGLFGEVVAASLRWPRRLVWGAVMVAMCVLPVALRSFSAPLPLMQLGAALRSPPSQVVMAPDMTVSTDALLPSALPRQDLDVPDAAFRPTIADADGARQRIDQLLLAALLGCSLVCLIVVATAARRMHRVRKGWMPADHDTSSGISSAAGRSVQVWLSNDVGPAAFGVWHPQVVLPRWVETLDEGARRLLIAHEASHIAARDPLVLRVALTLVVIMPWNLPLLMAYRRLHRAVEHDCDGRVLRDTRDAARYGRLLLATAERIMSTHRPSAWSQVLPAPVAGIGLRRSELELRLRALAPPAPTWRTRGRTVAAGGALVAAALAACSVPSPASRSTSHAPTVATPLMQSAVTIRATDPAMSGGQPSALDSLAAFEEIFLPMFNRTQSLRDSIVESAARAARPEIFTTASTETHLWLLVDARYAILRSATGARFHFVRESDAGPVRHISAFSSTPRDRLATANESFVRAFPGVTATNLNRWQSQTSVKVGARTVSIFWARYVPVQATAAADATPARETRTASATLVAPRQPRPADDITAPRTRITADSLAAARGIAIPVSTPNDSAVIAAARFAHPEIFSKHSRQMHVWLVVDEHFAVLRSTTGESFPAEPARGSLASSNEFYLTTFPELSAKYLTNSHTQTDVRVGRRNVSIFWALYPHSLLRRKA